MPLLTIPRQQLFPDAPAGPDLVVRTPPSGMTRTNMWADLAVYSLMFSAVALIWAVAVFFFSPMSWNLVWQIPGIAGLAVGIPALAVLFLPDSVFGEAKLPKTTIDFARYAAERGLFEVDPGTVEATGAPQFSQGLNHTYSQTFRGRVGTTELTIGALSWRKSSEPDDSPNMHTAMFATTQLPQHVADMFPACAVTRTMLPVVEAHDTVDGEELVLESSQLGNSCLIYVEDYDDHALWYQLFDPITIEGLANTYNIQWSQQGCTIVFAGDTDNITTAREALLDTICHGGAWVVGRYLAAARGDVAHRHRS